MNNEKLLGEIRRITTPMAQELGLTLWGVESSLAGRRQLLRIYVDGPNGVHVDQCAELSRRLSVVLDVEDLLTDSFVLEVSSPGLERRFFSAEQLAGYEGQTIQIQMKEPVDGRKNWQGKLQGTQGTTINLLVDGHPESFPWDAVKKSQLIVQDVFAKKSS